MSLSFDEPLQHNLILKKYAQIRDHNSALHLSKEVATVRLATCLVEGVFG
jgi:hypothetical protein